MATIEIRDDNFREIYQGNDIVALDFWAGWCGPCHQFSPIFEEASETFPQILFGKVNSESQVKLAGYFGIRSLPTLIVIREQLEVFRGSGVMASADLNHLFNQVRALDMDEVRKKIEAEEGG